MQHTAVSDNNYLEVLDKLTEAGINIHVNSQNQAIISYQGRQYRMLIHQGHQDTSKLTETAIFKIATLTANVLFQNGVFNTSNNSSLERAKISDKGVFIKRSDKQEEESISKTEHVFGQIQAAYIQGEKVEGKEEEFSKQLNSILNNSPKKLERYRKLYEAVQASQLDSSSSVRAAYNKMEEAFRKIEYTNTDAAWAQKADLLDAIDLLIDKYPHARLQPIIIKPPPVNLKEKPRKGAVPIIPSPVNLKEKPRKGAVPIIPYSKMGELKEKAQINKDKQGGAFASSDDMANGLHGIVSWEHSGLSGDVIRSLTNQKRNKFYSLFGAMYRCMTKLVGWWYNRGALPGSSNLSKIVSASRGMDIQPIEVLAKKLADKKGEVFFYRGPRYLFNPKKSIHEYTTVDEWFGRDLTPRARRDYLAKAKDLEQDLTVNYGASFKGASRVVISNSDSRVRVKPLTGDEFATPQEIVGKALSHEAAEEARLNKDDPTYYSNTYLFNTNNLLGLKTEDNLQPKLLNAEKIKEFKDDVALSPNPETQKKHEALILESQQELLAGMARTFRKEGAIQVVQRLAPRDVHHYTASVKGTPLSHAAAAEELKKRLSEADKNSEEGETLQQLIDVFNAQEEALGRKTQPTIDIYGGREGNTSVQTNAIDNIPAILSQNDRKVMLFLHEDGNISMHVFIGATGVNRVNVKTDSIQMEQGDDQGDMRPGEDIYTEDKEKLNSFATTTNTTRDGLKKLEVGDRQGGFNKQGSTVISYYLPTDFAILPAIQDFKEAATYQGATTRKQKNNDTVEVTMKKEAELLCQMGDPLLIKTEVAMAQYLERSIPETLQSAKTVDEVLEGFINAGLKPQDKADQSIHNLLQKILSSSSLSKAEEDLKIRLKLLLEQRLEIIKKIGIDSADIAILKGKD